MCERRRTYSYVTSGSRCSIVWTLITVCENHQISMITAITASVSIVVLSPPTHFCPRWVMWWLQSGATLSLSANHSPVFTNDDQSEASYHYSGDMRLAGARPIVGVTLIIVTKLLSRLQVTLTFSCISFCHIYTISHSINCFYLLTDEMILMVLALLFLVTIPGSPTMAWWHWPGPGAQASGVWWAHLKVSAAPGNLGDVQSIDSRLMV